MDMWKTTNQITQGNNHSKQTSLFTRPPALIPKPQPTMFFWSFIDISQPPYSDRQATFLHTIRTFHAFTFFAGGTVPGGCRLRQHACRFGAYQGPQQLNPPGRRKPAGPGAMGAHRAVFLGGASGRSGRCDQPGTLAGVSRSGSHAALSRWFQRAGCLWSMARPWGQGARAAGDQGDRDPA